MSNYIQVERVIYENLVQRIDSMEGIITAQNKIIEAQEDYIISLKSQIENVKTFLKRVKEVHSNTIPN